MPLLPVDLQTLFGQTPQVAKDQSVQQAVAPQAQAAQAAEMARRAVQEDSSVTASRQSDEGPEQVRLRLRREAVAAARPGGRRRRRRAAAEPSPRKKPGGPSAKPSTGARDVVRDPSLGRHVDLTR